MKKKINILELSKEEREEVFKEALRKANKKMKELEEEYERKLKGLQ